MLPNPVMSITFPYITFAALCCAWLLQLWILLRLPSAPSRRKADQPIERFIDSLLNPADAADFTRALVALNYGIISILFLNFLITLLWDFFA
jgi:hypothetical protein